MSFKLRCVLPIVGDVESCLEISQCCHPRQFNENPRQNLGQEKGFEHDRRQSAFPKHLQTCQENSQAGNELPATSKRRKYQRTKEWRGWLQVNTKIHKRKVSISPLLHDALSFLEKVIGRWRSQWGTTRASILTWSTVWNPSRFIRSDDFFLIFVRMAVLMYFHRYNILWWRIFKKITSLSVD